MASPSRAGAGSPAVRWKEKDLTCLLPSLHRARETLLGCQAGPRQSPAELGRLCASLTTFSPLSFFPSEDAALLLRQKRIQTQHRCPAASSPASSSSGPRSPARLSPAASPAVRRALTLSPRLPFLLPFLLQGCSSRPFQLTKVSGAEQPPFTLG